MAYFGPGWINLCKSKVYLNNMKATEHKSLTQRSFLQRSFLQRQSAVISTAPSIPRIIKSTGNTVAHNVAHNLCCFHPWHAEAARIIKLLRGARAHNVTFMKQPLSAHPTYSVHITMHFSLSMVLNRSRFLSAHNLTHNMAGHGPHSTI